MHPLTSDEIDAVAGGLGCWTPPTGDPSPVTGPIEPVEPIEPIE